MSVDHIVMGSSTGSSAGAASTQTYVDDVFSTYLYTGNGSTQTINNGIDLAGMGGMVWIKQRNITAAHGLVDTVRGRNYPLYPNQTNAQVTSGVGYDVTDFTPSGFSLGLTNQMTTNTNSNTYASWTFRKAAKFFDVVTYTGNGSSILLSHSLGVSPGMVIIKRTDAAGDWGVWHKGGGSGDCSLLLNSSAAKYGAGVAFTSSATSIRVYNSDFAMQGNINGATYVAYLFAHDTAADGMIQCGSFTTNGQTFINLGWEPQFVLMKNTTQYGWQIMDTMRGIPTGGITTDFEANNVNAERNMANWINVNATGFTANGNNLGNNVTFIYMAIRRPNKPPTSGTQVFSVHTWSQSGGL